MDIKGKQIIVLGLGDSGMAASKLAYSFGAKVIVLDEGGAVSLRQRAEVLRSLGCKVELECHSWPREVGDYVVISPGVVPSGVLGRYAREVKCPVLSELEFGWRFMKEVPVVAITGTNGKTTTTELCSAILKANGVVVSTAGNIGYPVSALVVEGKQSQVNVFEVSSFQLEHIQKFRPAIGVLTNVTPDHLERYDSMRAYLRTKCRLFENQSSNDWAVMEWSAGQRLSREGVRLGARLVTYSADCQKADVFLDGDWICCGERSSLRSGKWLNVKSLRFEGRHNIENVMAAMVVAAIWGVSIEDAARCVREFKLSGHRCELVVQIEGVRYIDDSKATNVDATRQALRMAPIGRRTWLIAGGKYKGFDFSGLEDLLGGRVKEAILIGETKGQIQQQWKEYIPCVLEDSLEAAVEYAAEHAVSGDVVLLSPMCSSFDMFRGYAHRGEVFKQCVEKIEKRKKKI